MRVAAIADLHGNLVEVPQCDLLLIAGDVTPTSSHDVRFQAHWLDTQFRAWLEDVPATHVVGIAGNHDFVFERDAASVPTDLRWSYLLDGAATVDDAVVWGSPWTPWFFDWAFNAPKGEAGEPFLRERYAGVDAGTDILVIHGPPRGYGDRTAAGIDAGSVAQAELIERVDPKLCVYGHIHEGRGQWQLGGSVLANVSAVDLQYALYDDPVVVFDL